MMYSCKCVWTLLLSLLLCGEGWAQQVSGRVVDDHKQPLEFVNVILLRDSTFLDGIITDANGAFVFENIPTEKIFARISYIGYETALLPVPANGKLGTITLQASSEQLDEVVIEAKTKTTEIKGDAMVTNVAGSILSKAGTANDVLRQIPMVVDNSGTLEVFGKGAPLIYINGRKMQDINELQQINSQDIKNVEVITNPGARYDASVKSVIRITTKRPQGEGWSGTLRTQNGYRSGYKNFETVDLKYRTGGWEFFTNLNYDNERREVKQTDKMLTKSTTTWQQEINTLEKSHSIDLYGKFGTSWIINEHHSVGAFYQHQYKKSDDRSLFSSDVWANDAFYDHWNTVGNNSSRTKPSHYANLYYNGTAGKLEMDLNVDYLWRKQHNTSNNDEESEMQEDQTVNTLSQTHSRMVAEKFVLGYPVLKGKIEIGEELTDSRFSTDFMTNTTVLTDANSEVNESNQALFAQLSQTFGPITASVGIRYEHVNFNYYEKGQLSEDQSRRYDNLFPSVALSGDFGPLSLSLNYSNKTERPHYSMLDGTVSYLNRMTYQSGNPLLQPMKDRTLDFTAVLMPLFLNISYSDLKDPFYNTTKSYDDLGEIKLITYENFPKNHLLQAFIGGGYKWGVWMPRLNAGIIKQWFTVPYDGGEKSLSKPMPVVQFQNAFNFPKDILLNINCQWFGVGEVQNVRLSSSSYVDMKLQKEFMNKQLNLSFEVRDIFNKSNNVITFYNNDVTGIIRDYDTSRRFYLTLQYRFNVTKDRYRGGGAGATEKARF